MPLAEVNDGVFSHEVLGIGVAIRPTEGVVRAPFDGIVTAMINSGHAVGLCSSSGLELLVHIGIDTIHLNGEYFTSHVKKGDSVKKGDILMEFDCNAILSKGYDITSPVVISNWDEYESIQFCSAESIQYGEKLTI